MELGTEDIFLEANRKPGSVVQRFGNEGQGGSDAKTFSNALAAGMTIMNSTNRRAIVRVRPVPAPGSPEDIMINGTGAAARKRSASIASAGSARAIRRQSSSVMGAMFGDAPPLDEGLEHKLHLGHLRRIGPHFLVSEAIPPAALMASSSHSNSTPLSGGGATSEAIAFAQYLTTLQRRTENELWLHGPPPIPAGTLSQLEIKKPEQFTHVRSAVGGATASQRHKHDTRSLDELSAREYDPKVILQRHHHEERQQRLREKQQNVNKLQDPQQLPGGAGKRRGGAGVRVRQTSSSSSDSDDDVDGPEGSLNASSTRQSCNTTGGGGDVHNLLKELFTRPKRTLTEQQFVHAVLTSHVATATVNGAQQLFRKIDVESIGEISFDAFLSFLVSNQKTGGTSSEPGVGGGGNPATAQSSELVPVSVPRSCPPWHQHERLIATMAVSPRTGTVFTGGCDGCLRSWDPVTLRHQKLWYSCNSWIIGIVFTFREQRLIICTVDRQVVVFDAKSGDVLRLYRGRRVIETENGLSFAHESIPLVTVGGKVVSHAAPKGTKIRRTGTIAKLQQQQHQQQQQGESVVSQSNAAEAPEGGADQKKAKGKKGGSGATPTPAPPPPPASMNNKAKQQGAMTFEQYRAMLDEEKNNQLERRRLEEYILAGLTEPPSCVEYHYSKADEDVLFFGMDDGSIRIFIIPTSHQRLVRQHYRLRPHTARVRKMQVIPQLEGILSCGDDGTLKLTHLVTGQVIKDFCNDAHESSVNCFAYSTVLKLFISSGGERHGLVWDQLQESPVARLDEHACPTLACAINDAEWQFITVGVDNSVFVFSARTYKLIQQFHERIRAGLSPLPSSSESKPAGGGGSEAAMAHAASTANQNLYSVSVFDNPRQRLLLGTTYPVMHQLRRNVATLPANYCGHTSPVVATLFNTTFQVVLTIDAEHLVLGWDIVAGQSSGLSFSISSFASPHDDLRLTACALDVMQRRLITGFHIGTVVVWNVFNGQSLCVIKAALPPMAIGAASSSGALTEGGKRGSTRRVKRGAAAPPHQLGGGGATIVTDDSSSDSGSDDGSGASSSSGGGSGLNDDASSAGGRSPRNLHRKKRSGKKKRGASSSSVFSTDVIAVAAIQRDSTHYMFSLGQYLVVLKETPSFTVANPPRHRVPASIGSVAVLMPCSPVLVALGTTTGAVAFFNIASETMDGSPLWADETAVRQSVAVSLLTPPDSIGSGGGVMMEAFVNAGLRKLPPPNSSSHAMASPIDDDEHNPRRPTAAPTSSSAALQMHQHMSTSVVGMLINAVDGSVGCVDGVGLSRIVALFPLKKFQCTMLLALHADGKLVMWDVPHRRCVGVYSAAPHSRPASSSSTTRHSSNLIGKGDVAGGSHSSSIINIVNGAMDQQEEFLVHGDDAGNVTVLRITYDVIASVGAPPLLLSRQQYQQPPSKGAESVSRRSSSSSTASILRKSSSPSPKLSHATAAPPTPALLAANLLASLDDGTASITPAPAPLPPAVAVAPRVVVSDIRTVSHFYGLTSSLTALCVTGHEPKEPTAAGRASSPHRRAASPPAASRGAIAGGMPTSPSVRVKAVVVPDMPVSPAHGVSSPTLRNDGGVMTSWGPLTTSSVVHSVEVGGDGGGGGFFSNGSFASHMGGSTLDLEVPNDIAIVTTSTDFFSRVFDLHGHHMGDFGMHKWRISQPTTFREPDRTHSPVLPSTAGEGEGAGGHSGDGEGSDSEGDFLSTIMKGGHAAHHQHHASPSGTQPSVPHAKDLVVPRIVPATPSPQRQRNTNIDVGISVTVASVQSPPVTPQQRNPQKQHNDMQYILPEILTPNNAQQQQFEQQYLPTVSTATPQQGQLQQPQRPTTNHQQQKSGGGPVRSQRAGIVKEPTGPMYDGTGHLFGASGMESTTRMSFSSDGDGLHGPISAHSSRRHFLGNGAGGGSAAVPMSLPPPGVVMSARNTLPYASTTPPAPLGGFGATPPPSRRLSGQQQQPHSSLLVQTARPSLTGSSGSLMPAFGSGRGAAVSPHPRGSFSSGTTPPIAPSTGVQGQPVMSSFLLASPQGQAVRKTPTLGVPQADALTNSFRSGGQSMRMGAPPRHGSMSSMSGLMPTPTPVIVDPAAAAAAAEASRSKLLTSHLDRQLQRLQSCKPDLNQELRRIETRIRKSTDGNGAGGGGDDLSKLSWTSRVAARLELHELDDIQPPAGSRASNDAGRRTHNRIRLLQRGGGGAGGVAQQSGGGGQQRAPDFFPSVTAPGTVLVGINDVAAEEDE